MLNEMKSMGMSEIASKRSLIATKNKSLEEAMEYYYQNIQDPAFNAEVVSAEEVKKKKKKPRLIPLELQRLFTQVNS